MYSRLTLTGNVDQIVTQRMHHTTELSDRLLASYCSFCISRFWRWLQSAADADNEYDRREENTKSSYSLAPAEYCRLRRVSNMTRCHGPSLCCAVTMKLHEMRKDKVMRAF
jgi:hypothetical protein